MAGVIVDLELLIVSQSKELNFERWCCNQKFDSRADSLKLISNLLLIKTFPDAAFESRRGL